MKKITSLALASILVLSMAGCGSSETAIYTAGTYEGTAKGHNGDITVSVKVDETKITEITVGTHAETAGISDPAFEQVIAAVVEKQTTEVDSVSGATITSDAIKVAIDAALTAAKV